jgi:hypothetical protein
MQMLKRILRVLLIFIAILLFISLFLFTGVDRTPYKEMDYYTETIKGIESVDKSNLLSIGDTLEIGWAKETLLSGKPIPMAGYGARHGALYEAVHDSVWVKAFVFDNKDTKFAFVTMDLLLVPMEVAILLPEALDSLGFSLENTFLTATHTHCSIGAWGKGMAGELFAGAYSQETVDFLVDAIAKSISKAEGKKEKSKIGYTEIQASDLVSNRLVGDQEGTIDPWLRMLKFVNKSNETALLTTFSAHATCLHHSFHQVSGDYPGEFCRNLENLEKIDFAAFSAGAVGSMAPLVPQLSGWPKVDRYADQLAEQVLQMENFIPVHEDSILGGFNLNLKLREPHFRVSENIRVRPWVFNALFGGYPSKITSFRIGNILFVGTPCDFSGELMEGLSKKAREKGLHLVITSFNGGYTGYITQDKWYDRDTYETRMMNWFGPYNGTYFNEIIEKVIDLHAGQK